MAIIYTYPTKATPAGNDLILISDSADSNKTKQIKVSSLPSSGGTPSLPLNGVQYRNANGNFEASSNLKYIDIDRTLNIGVQDVSSGILFIAGGQNGLSPLSGQLKLGGILGGVVTLKAAADISSGNYDIVLPSVAPGGKQILESDSSGQLSWISTPTGVGDTYTLGAGTKAGVSIPLTLDAATGSDSTVNFTEGANITLTSSGATEITIASSARLAFHL